jgi:RHS repeat-associated protein
MQHKTGNNGDLAYILFSEGRILYNPATTGYTYEYHLKDHLGSVRVAFEPTSAGNTVTQENAFYPFGAPIAALSYNAQLSNRNRYLREGKEYIDDFWWNKYDHGWRAFDPLIVRSLQRDPLAYMYPHISPYALWNNNPMRFIDPDGRAPGDLFRTINAAAKDWGMYYNGASILRGREFGSSIYIRTKDGKTYYSYSEAAIGSSDKVRRSPPPNNEDRIAVIHSHGKYAESYDNDFSNVDKWNSYDLQVDSYLTTPDRSLKKYDPYTIETTIISTDLPSDPSDPDRKNNVAPTDIPMEKKREQTTKEQDKKPELKIPEWEKEKISWSF